MRAVAAIALLAIALVGLAGCGGPSLSPDATSGRPPPLPEGFAMTEPEACRPAPDAARDIAAEPDWGDPGWIRRWAGADGCAVRADVVHLLAGPTHCHWQTALLLTWNGGSPGTGLDVYVRDPDGALAQPMSLPLDLDAAVPPGAVSTGYRRGRWTLWHVPGDDGSVWLVRDDGHAERWPRPAEFVGCA